MLAMEYKNFVWPNNPSSCRMELRREVAAHAYPGGGYRLEELGQRRKIFSGQGEFFGQYAYLHMAGLMEVYQDSGPGTLVHPALELRRAYFTELTLLEEPRENYVAYSFTFEEDGDGGAEDRGLSTDESYAVGTWDTLWDIAEKYDTDVDTLLELNPWIANPLRLQAGKRVTLP